MGLLNLLEVHIGEGGKAHGAVSKFFDSFVQKINPLLHRLTFGHHLGEFAGRGLESFFVEIVSHGRDYSDVTQNVKNFV